MAPSKKKDKITPSPNLSIAIFVITTMFYFIIKYNSESYSVMLFIVYVLFVIGGQLGTNVSLTYAICGELQWKTAIVTTFMSWTIIFGSLNFALTMFPGWLRPFSNTFGYGIAKLAGLDNVFIKILKPQNEIQNNSGIISIFRRNIS